MKILITGGCGFVGHHLVEHVLRTTEWEIVVVDKLSYASNGLERLRDIRAFDESRVSVYTADITQPFPSGLISEIGDVDYLIHAAAESHVDNSILDPEPFVRSNVLGTMHVLQYARTLSGLRRFVYFSTDEVFGPAPQGTRYLEWDRYNSTNPYAAAKAGGEELSLAWANTYNLPVIVTHTMNVYGERQHPEKFIPKVIRSVLANEIIPIHADISRKNAGSRFWIHARSVADAVLFLLGKSDVREKYNIVGEREVDNLSLALLIAKIVGKPLRYEMVDFHSSRPGHDLRYALDGSRLERMCWKPVLTLEESLQKTIKWTLDNRRWL